MGAADSTAWAGNTNTFSTDVDGNAGFIVPRHLVYLQVIINQAKSFHFIKVHPPKLLLIPLSNFLFQGFHLLTKRRDLLSLETKRKTTKKLLFIKNQHPPATCFQIGKGMAFSFYLHSLVEWGYSPRWV
jgi:hypothetical protein